MGEDHEISTAPPVTSDRRGSARSDRPIYVDAVGMKHGGGLSHVNGLVTGLRQAATVSTKYVFFHDTMPVGDVQGITVVRKEARGRLRLIVWRQVWFPIICLTRNAECVSLANYPVPLMWKRHIVFEANSKLYDRRKRCYTVLDLARRSARLRIFPTEAMRAEARAPKHSSVVIPHGISVIIDSALPRGAEADAVFVSYPSGHRRQDNAIRALARVRDVYPSATLTLTVSRATCLPEDRGRVAALEDLVNQLDLVSAVRFVGAVPHDVALQLLHASGITLLLTEQDAFGLPVAEAAAARRWVVCSDLPALREVAGPGCIFVDPTDDVAVAKAWLSCAEKNLRGAGPDAVTHRPWSEVAREFERAVNLGRYS